MSVRDDADTWEPSTLLMVVVTVMVIAGSVPLIVGVHVWAWARGVADVSWNPFTLVLDLAGGRVDPTGEVYWWIAVVALILVVVSGLVVLAGVRRHRS